MKKDINVGKTKHHIFQRRGSSAGFPMFYGGIDNHKIPGFHRNGLITDREASLSANAEKKFCKVMRMAHPIPVPFKLKGRDIEQSAGFTE